MADSHTILIRDVLAGVNLIAQVISYGFRDLCCSGIKTIDHKGFHRNGFIKTIKSVLVEPRQVPEFKLAEICHVINFMHQMYTGLSTLAIKSIQICLL